MEKESSVSTIATVILGLVGFLFHSNRLPTSGLEMIFSLADIEDNGSSESSILRWAPRINIQSMLNRDLSDHVGLFTGLAIRNVGYIYGNYTDPSDENMYKKKFRSFNLAVPFGIKIGNLDNMFLYGGFLVMH